MKTDPDYQRQLAESLIRSLGVEEAFTFALQNQWLGVLAHLPKDVPLRHAGPRVRRRRGNLADGSLAS